MEKSPEAFRTISEVAEFLETPAHVLRFWESRFPQIRPVKRAGGRRYYRPSDVALLSGIKRLLHDDGLTIRGVQKILQEQGVKHVAGLMDEEAEASLAAEAEGVSHEPIPLFPAHPVEDAPKATQDGLFDSLAEDAASEEVEQGGSVAESDPEPLAGADAAKMDAKAEPAPIAADGDGAEGADTAPQPEAPTPAPVAAMDPVHVDDAAPAPAAPTPVADDSLSDAAVAADGHAEAAPLSVVPEHAPSLDAEPPSPDPAASTAAEPDESAPPVASTDLDPAETDAADGPAPAVSPPSAPATPEPRADAPPRWIASDLRGLRATALHGKADQAEALARRLRVLRERLGSTGRPPVR